MRTLRLALLALLLLAGLGACGKKDRVKEPKPLLSEQQMVDLLSDVYVVEAMLNQKKAAGQQIDSLTCAYYDQLFEHFGITDSILEANMTYYTRHPEILERIMDSVVVRLETAGRDR